MSGATPWVRGELPWISSGPLFRIHRSAREQLDQFVERWNYRRIELNGTRMGTRKDAHAEIARAFEFPDYYGANWDAFNDCLRDFVEANDGALVAVIWNDIESTPSSIAAEVGWALLETHSGSIPSLDPGNHRSVEFEIFAIGTGDGFDRP